MNASKWKWFKVLSLAEFDEKDVPDMSFTRTIDGFGVKTMRVCKGSFYSIVLDGIYLPVGVNGRNAFSMQGRGAYVDGQRNLWAGFLCE